MIDWTFTMGNLLTMAGIAAAALSAFFYQRSQIGGKIDRKEFDDFQKEVMREYVSLAHLEKVEARMTAGMEVLANEIRGLRSDLLALYKNRSATRK